MPNKSPPSRNNKRNSLPRCWIVRCMEVPRKRRLFKSILLEKSKWDQKPRKTDLDFVHRDFSKCPVGTVDLISRYRRKYLYNENFIGHFLPSRICSTDDLQFKTSVVFLTETNLCFHHNPCQNGGTCKTDGTNLACQCPPGYLGSHCERECLDS